eukprot:361221-Chlamydomonas_euryale.AAC.1
MHSTQQRLMLCCPHGGPSIAPARRLHGTSCCAARMATPAWRLRGVCMAPAAVLPAWRPQRGACAAFAWHQLLCCPHGDPSMAPAKRLHGASCCAACMAAAAWPSARRISPLSALFARPPPHSAHACMICRAAVGLPSRPMHGHTMRTTRRAARGTVHPPQRRWRRFRQGGTAHGPTSAQSHSDVGGDFGRAAQHKGQPVPKAVSTLPHCLHMPLA